jgi:hypothetical protein
MNHTSRRNWTTHLAVWGAVCGLILRAAVPLLASGAAQLRGIAVAEVCTVYGVAVGTASHDAHAGQAHHDEHSPSSDQPSQPAATHTGDHCALTGLAAMAAPDAPTSAISEAGVAPPQFHRDCSAGIHDRCAMWISRLEHGPPTPA